MFNFIDRKILISAAVLCLLILIIQCKESRLSSTTFVQDIPDHLKTTSYTKLKTDFFSQMGIESMDSGYNGVQIRVIIGYSHCDSGHLIIFKEQHADWSAGFFTFRNLYGDESDTAIAKWKLNVLKTPKSGWRSFIKSIKKLGIADLPDYTEIPGYILPSDASSIVIEIGTRTKYRIYTYPVISLYKDKIEEAGKVEKIISLIEHEFDFKRLHIGSYPRHVQ